jgi:hypothetical protein
MIWRPKIGQHVVLCYGPKLRLAHPRMFWLHGRSGTVRTVGLGPKMINASVELDGEPLETVIVPRGNLAPAT